MIYRSWPGLLPRSVELCAARLPGREARMGEPAYRRLPPLIEALEPAIAPYLDKPFALFGHSMGAKIAFELARRLRGARGVEPVCLIVSGARGPQVIRSEPSTYDLPDREFVEKIEELNGTPREVIENEELMRLIMPVLRADFELVQTYEYRTGARLSCPIVAYGGLEDREVSAESLRAWGEHTSRAFDVRMLPGDHFFINTARSVLIEVLSRDLERARRGSEAVSGTRAG